MITDLKKRAIHRSRIIEGQMKGLEKMIQEEKYCMDILTQSLSIQKSLSSLNKLVLENHLRTHVTTDLVSGNEERLKATITELLSLYELNNVRSR